MKLGLFNIFKKKNSQNNKVEDVRETGEKPKIYSGMRVEVTTSDECLLFVAKVQEILGNTAKLHMYSEATFSPDIKPFSARIRGYNDYEKKAVYMEGVIRPEDKNIWYVKDLTVKNLVNERTFFRLDTDIDATLTTYKGHEEEEYPCRLLNISIGGACITSDHPYERNDRFLLKVKLVEDRAPSVIYCRILRVTEKDTSLEENTYRYEYGCKFIELPETDHNQIAENIFAAQSRKRRSV